MQREFSSFQKSVEFIFLLETKRGQLLREELKSAPAGSLYIRSVSGKHYFDRRVNDKRAAITHDLEMIYRLARKKYLQLKLQEHENQICRSKDRLTVRMKPVSHQISKLLARYRNAHLDLMRITLSPRQYQWVHENYPHDEIPPGTKTYKTYSGIEMRSKSERDIGNELELQGIPYRYGQQIVLDVSWMESVRGDVYDGKKLYYPDFLILTATGEVIVWEHLGRLDLFNYRGRNAEKLSALRQGGYCPEELLILTVEHDLEDGNFIRNLIARRIAPYM